ncbi:MULTISPECIES: hypothetical protein [unclassified Pseudomonas]|uniref:hypothetical protein n=1 Tax=unclassified Pseudomonas TaxID=196821 RepID=UPI0011ED3934|nr:MULTISPECIES: hypothetical protein [unclassified Pseudomonas]KAA0942308.1 hypothetical protein FQ182_27625 [Pseudomonas sp. ANT_H4]KAA0947574.1 hypothetical protein FQ186_25060 [Pseudomonas sp. ANT_H14]
MRLKQFFAFAIPFALLLPLGAQAAAPSNWPAGQRDNFIKDCSAGARQNIKAKNEKERDTIAKQHCECGADKINAELSSDEINQLMTNRDAKVELQNKAIAAISSCKVVQK